MASRRGRDVIVFPASAPKFSIAMLFTPAARFFFFGSFLALGVTAGVAGAAPAATAFGHTDQAVTGATGSSHAWFLTGAASAPASTSAPATVGTPGVVSATASLFNPIGAASGSISSVFDKQYIGARFQLPSATRILSAKGEFSRADGTLFVAVVPLASLTALPVGTTALETPFNPGEVLFSTTFTPAGAGLHTVPLNLDVPAGVYGIIFGSNALGATGSSGTPRYAAVTGSTALMRNGPVDGPFTWFNTASSYNVGIVTGDVSAPPVISAISAPRQVVNVGQNLTLTATVSDGSSYQWKRNGRPISGATSSSYTITGAVSVRDTGWYHLVATNAVGSTTSAVVFVSVVVNPAAVVAWGSNFYGQNAIPSGLTSVIDVELASAYSLVLKGDGTLAEWGSNTVGGMGIPAGLNDVVAISAASNHNLALKSDGSLVAWGGQLGQTTIPAGLSGVVAVAAGGSHNLVLKSDGTVQAWGSTTYGQTAVPAGLTGVVGIAAGFAHSLALKNDGTVVGWGAAGYDYGQAAIPAGLTNVVDIAAGVQHSLALKADGTVVAWGVNGNATTIPAGLANVVAISTSHSHNLAIKADGTLVAWGSNNEGESLVPSGTTGVAGAAAGYFKSLIFRELPAPPAVPVITLQPVNVTTPPLTGNVTVQADASGNPAPVFQWQRQPVGSTGYLNVTNDSAFSGATTKTLAVTAPSLLMSGDQFRCVATNSAGAATSTSALLTVLNVPVITTQPVNQSVTTGQSATFSVAASFSGALNYMWRRAGFMIPGSNGPTLSLPNVTRADADDYDVVIFPTAGGAATTSNLVSLQVAPTSYPTLVAPNPVWDLQPENDNATVAAILRLADGRAYVGGAFLRAGGQRRTSVLRLTADGAVDPGFLPPEIDGSVSALAAQADGKILITGSFTRVDGVLRPRVARLGPDGRVDPGFNVGGAGPSSTPLAVAALTDGNIVLGGSFSTYNGTNVNRLAWLDAQGALLPDARNNPVGGVIAPVNVLLALPGGKVAVGGNVTTSGSTVIGGLAILRPDGTPEPTFNVGAGGNSGGGVFSLALQPDGKLIAGGTFTTFAGYTRNRVVRLHASGAVDTSFDPGAGFTNTVRSLALQTDGKMVAGGSVPPGATGSTSDLTRLLPSGARDPAFVVAQPSTSVSAVAVQTDGRILIGGSFTAVGAALQDGLARLGTDGALDPGFDLALRGSASIGAMALLPNGQVLIARSFAYLRGTAVPARIARFNADGTRDIAFNAGGTGADNTIFGLVRTPDGKIVIGGSFTNYNGVAAGHLARLNADGSRDTTYNFGGAGFNGTINSVAHLLGGLIVAGGTFSSYNGTAQGSVALLDSAGNLVPNFAPVLNATVEVVAKSRDGNIVVGGGFSTVNGLTANRVARITPFGALDAGFNVGSGPNGSVTAIGVLPDNRLLVGGTFTTFNGASRPGLVRLNANGSVDPGFAPSIAGGSVYSLHLQEDGKVIVRGTFTSVGGQPGTTALARINSDGTVDTSFAAGGIVSSGITFTRLLMRDDGSLFVPAGTSVGLQVTRAAAAPTISTPPASAKVALGGSVTFAAVAASAAPAVYQWYRDHVPVPLANASTLTLTGVTASQAGHYTLEVKSELGTAVSSAAFLTVRTAPVIMSQFHSRAVGLGGATTFHVFVDAIGTASYEWRRNGVTIPGATSSSLSIAAVRAADAGSYTVVVTDASGSATSEPGILTVMPNPLAYSVRQVVAPPGLHAYFAIEGTEPKRLLLRALGPTLATFGVANVLADPRLTVWRANGTVALANDNWGTLPGADLAAAFAQVGATSLVAGSKDAVVLGTFVPGSYAVRIEGHNTVPGAALLELYDLEVNSPGRIAYVALRGSVESPDGSMVGGLTMTNSAGKRLLIRAVGPTLGGSMSLADPRIEVREGSTIVASNDDWSGSAAMSSVAAQAGAFPLASPSADAALVVEQRIGTGAYTATVTAAADSGEALLEFYDLPVSGSSAISPLVVQSPRAASVAVGAPLTLRTLAVGSPPLTYQWRKNGVAVVGATAATFATASAQPADAGRYDVVVMGPLGTAGSAAVPVSVGNSAVHRVDGAGYVAGGTVTITNTLSYEGTASVVGWDVTVPAGWSFVSSTATADVSPEAGATGRLGWAWSTPPPSPVIFSYTLQVPSFFTGPQSISAQTLIRNPAALEPLALPAPLVVPQLLTHSADSNLDFEISLFELTRVIELYNTRHGTVRTGAYRVDATNLEDGFGADSPRAAGVAAVLARFHSADTRGATTGLPRDGALDLFELTRVIELYNTRAGTVRTGRYHVLEGTEDGFAAGP